MYPYIDMHCDSLQRVWEQGENSLYHGEGMQSLQKLVQTGQLCQFFAVFFPLGKNVVRSERIGDGGEAQEYAEMKGKQGREGNEAQSVLDREYFQTLRNALYRQVSLHSQEIAMAHNYEEIRANKAAGKASALLTVEDGRMVDGRMEVLQEFYAQGVRALTLTWNHANCFGHPVAVDAHEMRRGLTAFGKEAVEEMNHLGMLIDVSHLSDGGFWDVVFLSEKPFIASHSNCRELVNHPRNLTDDMIRCLAEKGGVVGVNLYPPFVLGQAQIRVTSEGRLAEALYQQYIDALCAHVLHLIKIGGEDCVGIGTDFDGMEVVGCIDCPQKMELLFDALKGKGIAERQLEKFASENALRVIKEAMK